MRNVFADSGMAQTWWACGPCPWSVHSTPGPSPKGTDALFIALGIVFESERVQTCHQDAFSRLKPLHPDLLESLEALNRVRRWLGRANLQKPGCQPHM